MVGLLFWVSKKRFGNTYKRNHEGDYRCDDNEVRLLFADASISTVTFDNHILSNFSVEDIDAELLKGYRQRFKLVRDNHPWNDLSDMEFLTKIGAYRVDRISGKAGFTRAGILMLGKSESITEPECAPEYFVDYQAKMADNPDVRWSDRLFPDGSWAANLYQFFYRTYNKLAQTIPTPFILSGPVRIDESPTQIAIREALVNACVHASYAERGSILVQRNRGNIVFRNPGRMLISIEDFFAGGHTVCRNPILQKMFVLIGYGEKAGSGADYILKGTYKGKWHKPVIREFSSPDSIELFFDLGQINDQAEPQNDQAGPHNDQAELPSDQAEYLDAVSVDVLKFCRQPRSRKDVLTLLSIKKNVLSSKSLYDK